MTSALSSSLAALLGCRGPEPTLQKVRPAAPPPQQPPYPVPWGHQPAQPCGREQCLVFALLMEVPPQNLLYLTHPGACPAGLQRCPRLRRLQDPELSRPCLPGSLPWALPAAGLRPGWEERGRGCEGVRARAGAPGCSQPRLAATSGAQDSAPTPGPGADPTSFGSQFCGDPAVGLAPGCAGAPVPAPISHCTNSQEWGVEVGRRRTTHDPAPCPPLRSPGALAGGAPPAAPGPHCPAGPISGSGEPGGVARTAGGRGRAGPAGQRPAPLASWAPVWPRGGARAASRR